VDLDFVDPLVVDDGLKGDRVKRLLYILRLFFTDFRPFGLVRFFLLAFDLRRLLVFDLALDLRRLLVFDLLFDLRRLLAFDLLFDLRRLLAFDILMMEFLIELFLARICPYYIFYVKESLIL